jgi:hypothetical protein
LKGKKRCQQRGRGSVDLTSSGIDLHIGHVFQVHPAYDGATLSVTITDSSTGASVSQSYTVDMAAVLGGRMGYAGSTGTGTATQDILNWSFAPLRAVGLKKPGKRLGACLYLPSPDGTPGPGGIHAEIDIDSPLVQR